MVFFGLNIQPNFPQDVNFLVRVGIGAKIGLLSLALIGYFKA
jgi:hypothetical protein